MVSCLSVINRVETFALLNMVTKTPTSASGIDSNNKQAGLKFEVPTVHYSKSNYSSDNFTLADSLWQTLDTNPTAIAVKDEFARSNGLALELRFPWDDEKVVFSVKAFHQIHCIVSIEHSKGKLN